MSNDELHDFIGSDRHTGFGNCVVERRSRTRLEERKENSEVVTIYHTPYGTMTYRGRYDEVSRSWHPVEFPVKCPADIRKMIGWFEDVTLELDKEALEKTKASVKETGESALRVTNAGTSALMDWIQHLAGIENGHYLLSDCESEVLELFELIHRLNLRRTEIVASTTPCDAVYFIENTSTTLISPEQYRKYCKSEVTEYGQIIKDAGKIFILHMCGHLKELLGDLSEVPSDAFEAYTTPPVGNVSLLDGRIACPDKCLIGGTNATLWTRSASEICEEIGRQLDALPHHRGIVVSSAGVMPPLCPPSLIREVRDFVAKYPLRC